MAQSDTHRMPQRQLAHPPPRRKRGRRKPRVLQGLTRGFRAWPGAGSNRRPSDFQSDARTN